MLYGFPSGCEVGWFMYMQEAGEATACHARRAALWRDAGEALASDVQRAAPRLEFANPFCHCSFLIH
jgi:hypothetical protein